MNNDVRHAELMADKEKIIKGKDGREDIISLIRFYNYTNSAVEVGTWTGLFSKRLLLETNIKVLTCVDPYESYDEFKDAINSIDLNVIFQEATQRLAPFGSRVRLMREFSKAGAAQFENESLDFVYIDGNHGYEFVSEDISLWWPKVRRGGLLIGDDCVDYDEAARDLNHNVTIIHTRKADGSPEWHGEYGVCYAVREFCQKQNLKFSTFGTQFVIPK